MNIDAGAGVAAAPNVGTPSTAVSSTAVSSTAVSAAWRDLALASPDAAALASLERATPSELPPAAVMDAIVVAERLIGHVQALQAGLLADLAGPGRAGDVTGLVQVLVSKAGAARDPVTGEVDPALVQAGVERQAQALAATEVAAALCVPHRTASCRIDRAVELVHRLPVTLQALRSGLLDAGRARLIADGTRVLAPPVRAAVEAAIVPLARTRVSRRVQELLDRAVIAADPDTARKLEEQARIERTVTHRPGRHGMGHVGATLPADGAVTVFTLLDLLAQATEHPDDDRGIDARRADALVDICTELLASGRLDLTDSAGAQPHADGAQPNADGASIKSPGHEVAPAETPEPRSGAGDRGAQSAAARPWRGLSRHGRRPHLNVTVALSTLAGLDRLPGHLAGHGAITAELATSIAQAAGTINLIGVHPASGVAAAVSQTIYRPGRQVTDQIAAAAGTCRFPSCNQPAWRCDTDHRVPFDHCDPESGGLTRLWDCDPECRRHHLYKTHAQWTVTTASDDGDGNGAALQWTSPTGHHYTDHPREYAIPGEELDPWLAQIFAPARRQPPPPPDEDRHIWDRDEKDLQRVDSIRRRIETLRWHQHREHSLSRIATLKDRHVNNAATERGETAAAPSALLQRDGRLDQFAAAAADDSADSGRFRRRGGPDPDYRAALHIEHTARRAAGHPDDPPPF